MDRLITDPVTDETMEKMALSGQASYTFETQEEFDRATDILTRAMSCFKERNPGQARFWPIFNLRAGPVEEKPIIGLSPIKFVDEERNATDFRRAREICEAIIRHCEAQKPWPPDWDEEMKYVSNQLWKRTEEGGFDSV